MHFGNIYWLRIKKIAASINVVDANILQRAIPHQQLLTLPFIHYYLISLSYGANHDYLMLLTVQLPTNYRQ